MQFFAPRGTYRQGEAPYDIFKDRITAIKSIVETVKTNIANKYWDQLNKVTISELGKKLTKDQEVEKLNLYGSEPPSNIIPQNTEEIATQLVDYTMGKMLGKEIMMGRLPAMGTPTSTDLKYQPQTEPDLKYQPSDEVMMPKMNQQKLLDYVMSGGEMDWGKILKVMEERPSFLGEYSDLERTALNSVMGRDVMGELETGVKRAGTILDYYKESEKKIATNMVELAQIDPEKFIEIKKLEEQLDITTAQKNMEMYVDMYNRKEITYDSFLKIIGGYVEPAKLSDFETKLKLLIETGMWNTMTDDNKLKFFDAYVAPEEAPEIEKNMYDAALTGSEDYFGIEDWIYTDKKGFVKDEEQYRLLYAEYERGAKQIYEKTGEIKPKDYLSLEEAGKYTLPTPGTGKMGGYKPILNSENIPWSWLSEEEGIERETPKEAKEKEDAFGYIIGATYKNADGKLLKYLGNNEWEEISPSVEGRQKGIK